jgi:ketosteroid isomerase-like protein
MSEPTDTQRENIEVVRSTLDAFVRAPDSEELLALMDPDIEIFLPPRFPTQARFMAATVT